MAVGKYWRRYKAGGFLAAAICSLAALQIYMAHQHTASSTRVAGVGGRLHALWSRYKDRNLTMPKLPKFFAASPLRQKYLSNTSDWMFSGRKKYHRETLEVRVDERHAHIRHNGTRHNHTHYNDTSHVHTRHNDTHHDHTRQTHTRHNNTHHDHTHNNDTRHNNTRHVHTRHNDTHHDHTRHAHTRYNDTHHNDTRHTPVLSAAPTAHLNSTQQRDRQGARRGKREKDANRGTGDKRRSQEEVVQESEEEGAKRVLIFTMDSLASTIEAAKHGGPAGEITVRSSLEAQLLELGFVLHVAASDAQYARLAEAALARQRSSGRQYYSAIIMDPWTWAEKAPSSSGKAVQPRPILNGAENITYILDFFGNKQLTIRDATLSIAKRQVLTAFPSPFGESFLGFYFTSSTTQFVDDLTYNLTQHHLRTYGDTPPPHPKGAHHLHREVDARRNEGVIWGKQAGYLTSDTGAGILSVAANFCPLVSLLPKSASSQVVRVGNIRHIGHQSKSEFRALLANSKFLLGLGDPLSGPSALEAMLVGAIFINPSFHFKGGNTHYSPELRQHYSSQHPYMQHHIGLPYVCTFQMLSMSQPNVTELEGCLRTALSSTLRPRVPDEFTHASYAKRVHKIFGHLL